MSAVPITSIGVQDLTGTGDVPLGDELNRLPALRSTFGQSNSTRFIFYAGVDNVTDKYPPFRLDATGAGVGIFSNTGRFFYSGARINF